jgi:tetratricopeptide (TPR) repeat protein
VRVHVRENADEYRRLARKYGVQWTPNILELDLEGVAQHRIEGFLPVKDFLAQLRLGLAHAAFRREEYEEAERRFDEIARTDPDSEAAAEATYWAGASRYKVTGDPDVLRGIAEEFSHHFQDTPWAKKASVWASSPP